MKRGISYFGYILFFILFVSVSIIVAQTPEGIITLYSPDKAVQVQIKTENELRYSVKFQEKAVLDSSPLTMTLEGVETLGNKPNLIAQQKRNVDELLKPVVKEKNRVFSNHFNEIQLNFENNYSVIFRAYNGGVAYRFVTDIDKKSIKVHSEEVSYNFTDNHNVYFPEENSFYSHQERFYKNIPLSEINTDKRSVLPVIVDFSDGPIVAITEADLFSYAGMYLQGTDGNGFTGVFPKVATEEDQKTDRDVYVTKRANYIAETKGQRSFPWRVMIIEENDAQLIENQMVYLLARPLQIDDPSWIKPGKVAWDWYNANNLYDVDFRAGINNETYKYYIDFAAKYNLEYVILDEGWYELGDILDVNPDIDVEELVEYARQKSVGIILWVVWKTLEDQWDEAFEQFHEWDIKGIKVDFMQRDDQWMVDYYWRTAEEAANRNMLVNFHGSYIPKGIRRAYPNVITREGVNGAENNKWGDHLTPDYNVTIPFTRMIAGPLDYTPGSMVNAQKENFRPIYNRPMSMGTRCHQLAMFIVYESALQVLADSPSHYLEEEESMQFISKVPTVWDETHVLNGKISDFILVARRNGDTWYVGAMTDESPRQLDVEFSFLSDRTYTATIYQDGINSDRYASDYKIINRRLNHNSKMNINLAKGGGWVAIIEPEVK